MAKLTQKIVCRNVKRGVRINRKYRQVTRRICRNKYRPMKPVKHHLYWRDDEKACYENMHGTDVNTSRKGECGWYVNDRKKISDTFDDIVKPLEIVWRKN